MLEPLMTMQTKKAKRRRGEDRKDGGTRKVKKQAQREPGQDVPYKSPHSLSHPSRLVRPPWLLP